MGGSTVVGLLTGGGFLFLSAMLVPALTKRLNKATDVAEQAKTLSTTAVDLVTQLRLEAKNARSERDASDKRADAWEKWARAQRAANRRHSEWDRKLVESFELLVRRCAAANIDTADIRIDDPPSLDVPFNGDT